MDRRERFAEAVEQFRSAFEGMQSDLWTSLPAKVQSVDFDSQSCVLQPGLMAQFTGQDGTAEWIELPVLLDVPIQFASGGGFTLTFPLAAGDEGIVVFASRCIDNWWVQEGDTGKSGYARAQAELRMHSLSDAFFIPGIRNKTRLVSDINQSAVELRSDAGTATISILDNSNVYIHSDAKVQLDADGDVDVTTRGNLVATVTGDATVTATGNITMDGDIIAITATNTLALTATSALSLAAPAMSLVGAVAITGSLSVNGKDFTAHVHLPGGYEAGSTHITGNSGAPA